VVERAVSFSESSMISVPDLPEHVRDARIAAPPPEVAARRPQVAPAQPDQGAYGPSYDARPPHELVSGEVTFKDAKERWVAAFERDYIVNLLKNHDGNISHAAREADIDRKYFRKLMRKYDIDASIGKE
jgi:DNA-binding NtrC family response regulator